MGGLPMELLVYAENIYRRFPEEFVALGMPGLEEIFDIRPNGTLSRRISETPTEKTVELTLRRWAVPPGRPTPTASYPSSAPVLPPHLLPGRCGAAGYHGNGYVSPGYPGAGYVGGLGIGMPAGPVGIPAGPVGYPGACGSLAHTAPAPAPAPPPPPTAEATAAAAVAAAEEQVTNRLVRLEAALASLKPQVEAVLLGQARAAQLRSVSPPAAAATQPAAASVAPAAAAPAQASTTQRQTVTLPVPVASHDVMSGGSLSPDSPLRHRRKVPQLTITTPKQVRSAQDTTAVKPIDAPPAAETAASTAAPAAAAPAAPAATQSAASTQGGSPANSILRPSTAGGASAAPSSAASSRAATKERLKVETVRMAPSYQDPESPRSPGRYSVWR